MIWRPARPGRNQQRRRTIERLREELGTCRAGEIVPENALRGTFRLDCERGWLDVAFTLAPTLPPGVQSLSVRRGQPLGQALGRTATMLARAVVIIDEKGKVIYTELVREIAQEPDYIAALKAL